MESYAAEPTAEFKYNLEKARELFASSGSDVSSYSAPADRPVQTRKVSGALAPSQTFTVFESQWLGRVVGLKLGPAASFAGKARDLVLRAYWDGEGCESP